MSSSSHFDITLECSATHSSDEDTSLPSSFVQIWSAPSEIIHSTDEQREPIRPSLIQWENINTAPMFCSVFSLWTFGFGAAWEFLISKEKAVISWQSPVGALWYFHVWTHACFCSQVARAKIYMVACSCYIVSIETLSKMYIQLMRIFR